VALLGVTVAGSPAPPAAFKSAGVCSGLGGWHARALRTHARDRDSPRGLRQPPPSRLLGARWAARLGARVTTATVTAVTAAAAVEARTEWARAAVVSVRAGGQRLGEGYGRAIVRLRAHSRAVAAVASHVLVVGPGLGVWAAAPDAVGRDVGGGGVTALGIGLPAALSLVALHDWDRGRGSGGAGGGGETAPAVGGTCRLHACWGIGGRHARALELRPRPGLYPLMAKNVSVRRISGYSGYCQLQRWGRVVQIFLPQRARSRWGCYWGRAARGVAKPAYDSSPSEPLLHRYQQTSPTGHHATSVAHTHLCCRQWP